MKIIVQPCYDYSDPLNCGIAKGLRKKGILALVGVKRWRGVFLGIIPVWGKIPNLANDIALNSCKKGFKPTEATIGLFN